MAAIDILEILPAGHPRRQALIDIVRHLATGFARYQDAATGRWFQVVDRGTDTANWTETSASAMYTFMCAEWNVATSLPATKRLPPRDIRACW